jgi:hypothetical protein
MFAHRIETLVEEETQRKRLGFPVARIPVPDLPSSDGATKVVALFQ